MYIIFYIIAETKLATLGSTTFECFAFHFLVPACSADISFLLYSASTGYASLIYTSVSKCIK